MSPWFNGPTELSGPHSSANSEYGKFHRAKFLISFILGIPNDMYKIQSKRKFLSVRYTPMTCVRDDAIIGPSAHHEISHVTKRETTRKQHT